MLLASCEAVLDEDEVLECGDWIDKAIARGAHVVFLFEDIATHAAVEALVGSSPQLRFLCLDDCAVLDNLAAFGALYASAQVTPPTEFHRFTGLTFEPLALETERASVLYRLLDEISTALNAGDVDRATGALSIMRDTLARYGGTWAAKLYERAGHCKLLIDACKARHLAALPDAPLSTRSGRKLVDTWKDLIPLLDISAVATQLGAWPEISGDLKRLQGFVDGGKTALASDVAAINAGKVPTLGVMLWMAAYRIRVSEHYCDRGDGAAALAMCVGALELYLDFRLFEKTVLDFDYSKLALRRSFNGQGLFSKYRDQKFGDGVQCAVMVLNDSQVLGLVGGTSDVLEVIQLRNQCALAHGVQRLSSNDARVAIGRIKVFIKQAEVKLPTTPRWSNLLVDSFVLDWPSLRPKVFHGLLP